MSLPAGLHDYLVRIAKRAIVGKSASEVALYLVTQAAIEKEQAGFLGVKFTED
jgi:hypothetical protein